LTIVDGELFGCYESMRAQLQIKVLSHTSYKIADEQDASRFARTPLFHDTFLFARTPFLLILESKQAFGLESI
jgi:hypothetical protein